MPETIKQILNTPKILIVDDEPENIQFLLTILDKKYKIVTAENAKNALQVVENFIPDLILLDSIMPDIDGYELFGLFKSNPLLTETPVIFLSSFTTENDSRSKGLDLGAADYISKPLQKDKVLLRVNTHIKMIHLKNQLMETNKNLELNVQERTKALEHEIELNRRMNYSMLESERRFRALFEGAPETMLLIEIESGIIKDINSAGCRLLDIEYDKVKGMQHDVFFVVDHEKSIEDILNRSFKKGEQRVFPNKIRRLDGTQIPIETSVKTLIIDGEIYLLGILHDVSERVRYQEELIAAKEKAEEMNRLKSIFLANMSHELRTPLISILGFSEILREELPDPDLKDMVIDIHSSGLRLLDTFNLLLSLTDFEVGKIKVEKTLFHPEAIIEKVLNEKIDTVIKKGIEIQKQLSKSVQVYADKNMFKEVIRQVIDNAVKFTSKGKITISSRIITEQNLFYSEITVQDTGIGIKRENLELIFEEFRQVSEGNNRNFDGTGLGLTITRKFVEANNGKIHVNSKVDVGSTFAIKFPLNADLESGILYE